eukprot:SAG31_NODE_286_length_18467_cov_41.317056_2_plen_45_part_00
MLTKFSIEAEAIYVFTPVPRYLGTPTDSEGSMTEGVRRNYEEAE